MLISLKAEPGLSGKSLAESNPGGNAEVNSVGFLEPGKTII